MKTAPNGKKQGWYCPNLTGPLEKLRPEKEDADAKVRALSRDKGSVDQGLLEKFPELDEESALGGSLLLGLSGGEQNAAPFEEEIPLNDNEDTRTAALASFQVSGEGDYPALAEEPLVFGDIRSYLGAEGTGEDAARVTNPKGTTEAVEDSGSLKEDRSRKGFRGIVDGVPNFQRSPEKDAPITEMKKQAPADNEENRRDRLSETKNRDKRRDRFSLEVRDLRTTQSVGGVETVREILHTDEVRPFGGHQETELIVELHSDNRGSEPADVGAPKTASQAFEDILARELHQNLNNDIVRQASVVLKDGGEGTIKLSLRPESLGNVKIRLEMAENKITGHIIVETDEALRAFEREVSSLEQAFKESGFEGADLEMSLASGNGGAGEQWREGEASPFFSERFATELAASQYDASIERTDTPWADTANGLKPGNGQVSVNMLI